MMFTAWPKPTKLSPITGGKHEVKKFQICVP